MIHKLQIETGSLEWLYTPDIEYIRYGDLSRKLQLILPYRWPWEEDERFPLVVYIPGSAFYRQEMYHHVPDYGKLAAYGYVVAAVQYRESEIVKFPGQIHDINNAVAFLKEHAAEYHIDPDRIFLMGHSSGAYNALMTGMTSGLSEFDLGMGHSFRGIVAASAPSYLNYEPMIPDKGLTEYDPEWFRPELDMLGLGRFEEDMPLFQHARVENYVNRNIPPVLLLHGDRDEDVVVENSRKLYAALQRWGKEAEYYEIEGQGHGGPMLWDARLLDTVDAFLRGH